MKWWVGSIALAGLLFGLTSKSADASRIEFDRVQQFPHFSQALVKLVPGYGRIDSLLELENQLPVLGSQASDTTSALEVLRESNANDDPWAILARESNAIRQALRDLDLAALEAANTTLRRDLSDFPPAAFLAIKASFLGKVIADSSGQSTGALVDRQRQKAELSLLELGLGTSSVVSLLRALAQDKADALVDLPHGVLDPDIVMIGAHEISKSGRLQRALEIVENRVCPFIETGLVCKEVVATWYLSNASTMLGQSKVTQYPNLEALLDGLPETPEWIVRRSSALALSDYRRKDFQRVKERLLEVSNQMELGASISNETLAAHNLILSRACTQLGDYDQALSAAQMAVSLGGGVRADLALAFARSKAFAWGLEAGERSKAMLQAMKLYQEARSKAFKNGDLRSELDALYGVMRTSVALHKFSNTLSKNAERAQLLSSNLLGPSEDILSARFKGLIALSLAGDFTKKYAPDQDQPMLVDYLAISKAEEVSKFDQAVARLTSALDAMKGIEGSVGEIYAETILARSSLSLSAAKAFQADIGGFLGMGKNESSQEFAVKLARRANSAAKNALAADPNKNLPEATRASLESNRDAAQEILDEWDDD